MYMFNKMSYNYLNSTPGSLSHSTRTLLCCHTYQNIRIIRIALILILSPDNSLDAPQSFLYCSVTHPLDLHQLLLAPLS